MVFEIPNEREMERFGALFAELLAAPALLSLQGDLGMGKTTFARGFIQQLGHSGNVKSPTYTLVEPYLLERGAVYHFDLYRLCDPEELEFMGIRDYLDHSILLVEWPERGEGILPQPDLVLSFMESGEGRQVECRGDERLLDMVSERWHADG